MFEREMQRISLIDGSSMISSEIFREIERESPTLDKKNSSVVIHCHSEVVDWIYEMESESLEHVEKKIGKSIAFKIEPTYHLKQYEVFYV